MIKWLIKTWSDKHICQMLDTTHRKCEVFWGNLNSWENHWERGRVQKSVYRCYLLLPLARCAVFLLCEVVATGADSESPKRSLLPFRSRLYCQHVKVAFTYVNVAWSWRENAPFSNQPTCKSSPACCSDVWFIWYLIRPTPEEKAFFFILTGISLLTHVQGVVMVTWQSGFLHRCRPATFTGTSRRRQRSAAPAHVAPAAALESHLPVVQQWHKQGKEARPEVAQWIC